MSDPTPTKWLSDDGRAFDTESQARQHSWNNAYPVYSQSAVDCLTAERDVLLFEKNRLQEVRQQLEAQRDAALADAESLRRRMLVLERQRDDFANREWQLVKAHRQAELAHAKLLTATAEVCAWIRSGNSVPVDIDFVFREQAQKIAADIRNLDVVRAGDAA